MKKHYRIDEAIFRLLMWFGAILLLHALFGCASPRSAAGPDDEEYVKFVKVIRSQIKEDPLIGIWQGSKGGRPVLLAVVLNDEGAAEKLKAVILNGDEYAFGYGNGDPWLYVSPLAQRGVYAGKVSHKPLLWTEWYPTKLVLNNYNQFTAYDDFPANVKAVGGKVTTYLRKEPRIVAIDSLVLAGGSGFLLWNSAYVVTANHVLGKAGKISARFPDGTVYPAEPVARDARLDLAILKLQGFTPSGGRGLPIDRSPIAAGEMVHAIGYPLGAVLSRDPSIVSGQVSATSGLHDAAHQFRLTAPINPGNSGGPILNAHGAVVGVALAVIRQPKIEGVAFGIKISAYLPMLEKLPYTFPDVSATSMAAEDVFRACSGDVVFIFGK
jgi:hypothetical protein